MRRLRSFRALVLLVPLVALLPVGRVVSDWVEVSRFVSAGAARATVQSYDWVFWNDDNGKIVAAYVFPRGPAAEAGVRNRDVFYELDYHQYFNAADLRHAVEGIEPGSVHTYSVLRGDEIFDFRVRTSRYPTFLYPLSSAVWQFAIWGFMLAAFLHVLGLIIALPLAVRSRAALSSLILIVLSSLWMTSNIVRLLSIELLGPPMTTGSAYYTAFQALTLVGLVGWIGFPALLLSKVADDTNFIPVRGGLAGHLLLFTPTIVLLVAAISTTVLGPLGPFTQSGLIGPILFYACWYIAASAAAVLSHHLASRQDNPDDPLLSWNRTGSLITLGLALPAALSVLGTIPVLGGVTDRLAGWLVVGTQLLAVAPVLLVSLATLRHGKLNQVLTRGVAYLTVLGIIFFLFVGGMWLMQPYMIRPDFPRNLVAGIYVVVLLFVFERIGRRVRTWSEMFFTSERQRTRQAISRFLDRMRTIVSPAELMNETARAVGEAFRVRSAVLFLRPGPGAPWMSASYRPEPPYITERLFSLIWHPFEEEGRIWSRSPELNESTLPREYAALLEERGAILAVPVLGESQPIGLLLLARKRLRRAVYNLEDLDLIRALSSQLALAVERLNLVERERALVRETAEAQLVALRAQINPHFLFNALNTIVALIEEKPDDAEKTVEHLAAIFRHILRTGGQSFVPLETELALVNHYLAIEHARFGQKLKVETAVDEALLGFPIPAFTLQTLIENAVKHGIEKRRGGGVVRIEAQARSEGGASITVTDTGIGIPALFNPEDSARTSFYGIGLRNVQARLDRLYNRPDLLQIYSHPEQGTIARLTLPSDTASNESHVETYRQEDALAT